MSTQAGPSPGPWLEPFPVEPERYEPHLLHGDEQDWTETNCYTDLWIELLHAVGAEPLAVAAFAVSADFEGAQWEFIKPPIEDLAAVYRIKVGEMNVWRPVFDHVVEELARGHLLTVEVDSWHLPDTAGTTYRHEHAKTSIVPVAIDVAGRRLRYLHGRGCFELDGDDYEGITAPSILPPYVELVRIPEHLPDAEAVAAASVGCLRRHLRSLPSSNPITRLAASLAVAAPDLVGADEATFHAFAFGTLRQCGASAGIAAAHLAWVAGVIGVDLAPSVEGFRSISTGAKSAQFALARAVRGRTVDLATTLGPMAVSWDRAIAHLRSGPVAQAIG